MAVRLFSRMAFITLFLLGANAVASSFPLPKTTLCQSLLDSREVVSDANSVEYPQIEVWYEKALSLARDQDHPVLSIVIPAYKESARIGVTISKIKDFFETFPFPVEILIRIEKSPDNTVEVTNQAVQQSSIFKVSAHEVQRGKGYAVRQGMLEATGDYVLFMDADLSTPLPEIFKFLAAFADRPNREILIADRHHSMSVIGADQPAHRKVMGAIFRKFTTTTLATYGLKGIHDTQCGFKMFTRKASQQLFSLATNDGFAFDMEILLMAAQLQMSVEAIPVHWYDAASSKVNSITDPFKMLRDTMRMKHEIKNRMEKPAA